MGCSPASLVCLFVAYCVLVTNIDWVLDSIGLKNWQNWCHLCNRGALYIYISQLSKCRLGIPEDRDSILLRSSLLDSLSSSSPWTPSSPTSSSWSKRSGLKFPFSWITQQQQQQHQSPRQITADLLTQLLGQYFASQGLREILGNRLQEPYTRGQRPRFHFWTVSENLTCEERIFFLIFLSLEKI